MLQILVLIGLFCLVMGIYETMEYMWCYDKEKKEYRQRLLTEAPPDVSTSLTPSSRNEPGEGRRLLGGSSNSSESDIIQMQTMLPSTRICNNRESVTFEGGVDGYLNEAQIHCDGEPSSSQRCDSGDFSIDTTPLLAQSTNCDIENRDLPFTKENAIPLVL